MTRPFQTLAPLLLADPSPCLRLLVLRELLGRPEDDAEVRELAGLQDADPLIADVFRLQAEDGSWRSVDLGGQLAKAAWWPRRTR